MHISWADPENFAKGGPGNVLSSTERKVHPASGVHPSSVNLFFK